MKLFIDGNTAGRSCGLMAALPYFYRFIQEELDKEHFQSSFEELWITFAYPPTFVLKSVEGIEKPYKEWYEKFDFPYSRFNRRFKTINITLKTPEFSESFERIDSQDEIIKIEIEKQYQNLTRTEIAHIFIDKMLIVGEIIKEKLKQGDIFDFDHYRTILFQIKEKINDDFIHSIAEEQEVKRLKEKLEKALAEREKRKNNNSVKNKTIRDIRVYFKKEFIPNKGLYPFDYQYVEIFLNLMKKYQFQCPTYHHLYIQIGKTEVDALHNMLPQIEDWYIFGISTIDYKRYLTSNGNEKEAMVFDTIYRGLLDIIEIDKLDKANFEKIVTEIKLKGLDTELIFDSIENDKYKLVVSYLSRSIEEKCPIYFTLTDKKTNRTCKKEIGKADKSQIYYWLQKITLTKNVIKVKSSNSIAADVWLKDLPRSLEFNYSDWIWY